MDEVARWDPTEDGVLRLPSGRLVRGRGLRDGSYGAAPPEFGLHLLAGPPPPMGWPSRCLRWPDWWLPAERDDARDALVELYQRAEFERIEVACSGGKGRTGTALACVAILGGVPAANAIDYARQHYNLAAVETPWQRRYVRRFEA